MTFEELKIVLNAMPTDGLKQDVTIRGNEQAYHLTFGATYNNQYFFVEELNEQSSNEG